MTYLSFQHLLIYSCFNVTIFRIRMSTYMGVKYGAWNGDGPHAADVVIGKGVGDGLKQSQLY